MTLVGLLLAATPATVSAECSNHIAGEGLHLNLSSAFLATVTEASGEVDPSPDGSHWDWHVELTLDETYLGAAPKSLVFNGYSGGCGDIDGSALQAGDRIIVAVEELALGYLPAAPFEGNSLIWHETSEGWSFYLDAVPGEIRTGFFPDAALKATTKAGILNFIATHSMPETSTEPAVLTATRTGTSFLVALASALGLAIGLDRIRRRASRDIRRR